MFCSNDLFLIQRCGQSCRIMCKIDIHAPYALTIDKVSLDRPFLGDKVSDS